MALRVRGLTYVYHRGTPRQVTALRDIHLDVPAGTSLALIGHIASGKSTLVQHFNGLIRPQQGEVRVLGIDVGTASPPILRQLRQRVGLVFQFPEYQLFAETVREDVAFGPRNMGLEEGEVEERVLAALDWVDLPRSLLDRSPFTLSGGERRRVAIAGVLAMDPEVLILDEPAAGLDPRGRRQLLQLLSRWQRGEVAGLHTGGKARQKTVILVTHDMATAAAWAHQVAVLHEGRLVMKGSPREIFQRVEELEKAGLSLPPVTEVLHRLRARGLPVPTDCLDVAEAAEVLWALGRKGLR